MTLQKIIPGLMAVGLVSDNLAYFRRKKKRKSLTGLAVENIVGSSIISDTANFV